MTRLELLRSGDEEQVARLLCEILEDTFDNLYEKENRMYHQCHYCPARNTCYTGHKGFRDWLKGEAE